MQLPSIIGIFGVICPGQIPHCTQAAFEFELRMYLAQLLGCSPDELRVRARNRKQRVGASDFKGKGPLSEDPCY